MNTAVLVIAVIVAFGVIALMVLAVRTLPDIVWDIYAVAVFRMTERATAALSDRPRLTTIVLLATAAARGAIAAWLVYLASFLVTDVEVARSNHHLLMVLGSTAVMFPIAVLLRSCEVSQNRARPGDADLLGPIVLFLRGFRTDGVFSNEAGFLFGIRLLSEEEELAEVFRTSTLGSLVALARPGDDVQEMGADRLAIGSQDWKALVGTLVARANAIVMRLGASDSLLWELQTIVGGGKLHRTLLLPPAAATRDARDVEYAELLARIMAGAEYPSFPLSLDERARFLYFDRDGKASVVLAPESSSTRIETLLAPFFSHLGVSPPERRFRPDDAIGGVVSACLVSYLVIWLWW